MIELTHIPVPETLDICQLDKQRYNEIHTYGSEFERILVTTRGEAPALAQNAHTTVCTLFIQHRASSGSSSRNVDSSVATTGLIPRGPAWDMGS